VVIKGVERIDKNNSDEAGLFTENALRVLENRYLKKDPQGTIDETPRELFERVAKHVAGAEQDPDQWTKPFFDMMWSRRFVPNSPTLMNAGRPLGMLSACFVLPLEDSIADIMETARQIALVQRAGGGTGIDLSKLRPKGSIVQSSGGTTDGPLSFLRMLSAVTDAIQQGAFRRGANMGTMRLDHPDILSFIRLKEDLTRVTNYNLSCTVPDLFMDRVKNDRSILHEVVNPHDQRKGYLSKVDDGVDYEAHGSSDLVAADYWTVGEIFELIVRKAWESGEPGLIFLDRINEVNPTPNVGPMTSTNPCGEQPLLPYEACNLGSLNLAVFYRRDSKPGDPIENRIDWDGIAATVRTAIRFLDDVVEANNYPTPEIDRMCRANRKIGLGVMGWADLLFELGLGYDSEEALDLARKVGEAIQREAWNEDTRLAEEKGVFEFWKGSRWDKVLGRKMRNAHCVTIAPTGTISIIAGCSGGIEPIFSLVFKRQVMRDSEGQATVMYETNPVFLARLKSEGLNDDQIRIVSDFASQNGTIDGCPVELSADMRRVFRSARDVGPDWHVRMQAAWQEFTDAAVSKTINFSSEATVEEVETAYLLAFDTGCKGITVYRDGSRKNQPMALDAKKSKSQETAHESAESLQAEPVTSGEGAEARADILDMLLDG
jgi:ribonucleoside-diphosphate reductase alpha chain